MNTQLETIYVLVGNRIRQAEARVNKARGIATIDTSSGPIEVLKWHRTERGAKLALTKKLKGRS